MRVIGADITGMNKSIISLKKIARMTARIAESQKLKQKSQLNNSEISLGALAITSSRTSSLHISKIANAEAHATIAARAIIKYTVDITLS